ncbi:MAG TPA: hypothetical protein VJC03_01870, partial [bacterium]|nr:hypothetical protein [bacterium]
MKNKELAGIFRKIARLLELKGENVFRIRSYDRAALVIDGLPEPVEELAQKKEIGGLKGFGKGLEEKIDEFLSTGKIALLEELEKEIPPGLPEMCGIPGFGPKKVLLVYEKLKIKNIADLEKAARRHR